MPDPSPDSSSPGPSTPPTTPPLPTITNSEALYTRARRRIPGVTQTLAKGPGQYVRGVAPKYLRRGRGSHVEDVDGNVFLDFNMAIGPISLGYAHPEVDAAVRAQLVDGITFSMMHPLEVEVAELVHLVVPGADMVRFSKTGADVTSAAVRLARAFTGRSKVLCCGYHGWHDWYIATTDRRAGVPPEVAGLTHTVAYNDLASVEEALDHDTACVILEPTVFEEPRPGFLERLLRLCHGRGALLVFDEMWTGFRCALGGAQERFGVTADLACFSKAIANGMPLSVLSGRGDVMRLLDREVFSYTTFGGEALSLAAAKATIEFMRAHDVPAALERQGARIKQGYNQLVAELDMEAFTRCVGMGCRSMVVFEAKGLAAGTEPLLQKSLVQQELFRRGVLWSGFHNMCHAHGDAEVATLLAAYAEVLPVLRQALESGTVASALRGDPMEPVFRKTSGFHSKPRPPARREEAHAPR
jgi:glutamate-1-semialdehyde 2,1-aminomutase